MNEKTNISVILPVYRLDEITKPLFANAVKSVEEQTINPDELLLVVGKDDKESIDYINSMSFGLLNVRIILNEGETDFASQFNLGVKESKSDWVSLLEQDDEYAKIWFKNAIQYRSSYPNVDIFLPIIVDVNGKNEFISFTNEATWAQSFSDVLGVLDNNALDAYPNFNIDGMVIRKETYESYGGIKKNIKLTFIYEFLLRMTLKDAKVMTIPKFGYKHTNQREGSLFHGYTQTINAAEAKWWLHKAKQEQYQPKDREITFDSNLA